MGRVSSRHSLGVAGCSDRLDLAAWIEDFCWVSDVIGTLPIANCGCNFLIGHDGAAAWDWFRSVIPDLPDLKIHLVRWLVRPSMLRSESGQRLGIGEWDRGSRLSMNTARALVDLGDVQAELAAKVH